MPLCSNLTRLGIINAISTVMRGQQFGKYEYQFDKILVDAPCSGTGTIRKSVKTIMMWNPGVLKSITSIQRELLKTAWKSLKKGGTIVYSTCSLEPEENEGVISWFLDHEPEAKLESFELPGLIHGDAVMEFEGEVYNPEVKKTCRMWPQDNDTEGFFIAKLVKE